MDTKKIIQVVTSEIEIVTRHYTYEVFIDTAEANSFIEKMDGLCGHKEIYDELNKHEHTYVSTHNGKQYPTDDNYTSEVASVEMMNQIAWSL